jgi:hypothetical protein
MAGLIPNATAERLIEDLTRSDSVMEFRTTRFKFKARVTHAEQWQSVEGQVSVVFKVETLGAPQPLETEPEAGWKP